MKRALPATWVCAIGFIAVGTLFAACGESSTEGTRKACDICGDSYTAPGDSQASPGDTDSPGDSDSPPDALAPSVTDYGPKQAAVDVDTGAWVTFSEAVNMQAADSPVLAIDGASGALLYDDSTFELSFVPATTLRVGVQHTARLSGQATDAYGNSASLDLVWNFTTEAAGGVAYMPLVETGPGINKVETVVSADGRATATWMSLTDALEAAHAPNGTFGPAEVVGHLPYDNDVQGFPGPIFKRTLADRHYKRPPHASLCEFSVDFVARAWRITSAVFSESPAIRCEGRS